MSLKLLEIQRPVIQSRGQTEAVIHQSILSGTVSCIHAPYLGNGHMGLVNNDQKVIRKEIQQSHGRLSRFGSRQMSGIILDTGAKAGFTKHLYIEIGPLRNPLGLNELVLPLEILHLLL